MIEVWARARSPAVAARLNRLQLGRCYKESTSFGLDHAKHPSTGWAGGDRCGLGHGCQRRRTGSAQSRGDRWSRLRSRCGTRGGLWSGGGWPDPGARGGSRWCWRPCLRSWCAARCRFWRSGCRCTGTTGGEPGWSGGACIRSRGAAGSGCRSSRGGGVPTLKQTCCAKWVQRRLQQPCSSPIEGMVSRTPKVRRQSVRPLPSG